MYFSYNWIVRQLIHRSLRETFLVWNGIIYSEHVNQYSSYIRKPQQVATVLYFLWPMIALHNEAEGTWKFFDKAKYDNTKKHKTV